MAANTWELVRDLGLAERRIAEAKRQLPLGQASQGDIEREEGEVQRLLIEIQTIQANCAHHRNPERPERCLKCGCTMESAKKAAGPALAKTKRRSPLDIRRRAS